MCPDFEVAGINDLGTFIRNYTHIGVTPDPAYLIILGITGS